MEATAEPVSTELAKMFRTDRVVYPALFGIHPRLRAAILSTLGEIRPWTTPLSLCCDEEVLVNVAGFVSTVTLVIETRYRPNL
jgi:hypothetical protein